MVALWNSRIVIQSSDLKTSSIPPMSLEAPTVKSVTCGCFVDTIRWGFVTGIRTNIHSLAAFPVLLLIHIENPHHYWNVVYR